MSIARLDTSLELLLEHAGRSSGPAILATLVATAGSTYRKPGARMLILADGSYVGLLSGGCLEADMRLHAEQVLSAQRARAVEYDMRGPDDVLYGLGAGCAGALRILLEPLDAASPAMAALQDASLATRAGVSSAVVAVHDGSDLPLGTYGLKGPLPARLQSDSAAALAQHQSRESRFDSSSGCGRALVQFLSPPPRLLICGAGPDAVPVAAAGRALGWQVIVVDHRPAYAIATRFAGTTLHCAAAQDLAATVDLSLCHAAVVMSHHLPSDVHYLRALALQPSPAFVGLLGPTARRHRILNELGTDAYALHSRLHGPVGIDIGAATPEGIALSIISQIHAWLAGRLEQATDR